MRPSYLQVFTPWCIATFLYGAHAYSSSDATVATVIPQSLQLGSSNAQFVSTAVGLDGPKVHPINSSAYDWWYFDAVGGDGKSSVVLNFFTATAPAFPFIDFTTVVTSVALWASFPNGTLFRASLPAEQAVVFTRGDGSSGSFDGTGFSWVGAPDLSKYVVEVNSPTAGIKGSLVFESVCGIIQESSLKSSIVNRLLQPTILAVL